ncbi:MAG: glycosyltransferase [Phenylobacterium sp.]|uniref:CgeB family protein n=1 Tax=Phenylobacterium sp. TaxID=1871053 RepID=UPI0039198221
MRLVVLGLSLSSSWGNGHATTYRSLLAALERRGHEVLFLERDMPWYAAHRDPDPGVCRLKFYGGVAELQAEWAEAIRQADAVLVGSYVPDGRLVIDWVLTTATGPVAFYDIDTPITLSALAEGTCEYLSVDQVARFDAYFSFSGGRSLEVLHDRYGARRVSALYCAVDPRAHRPLEAERRWDLSYLGTYSPDRQPPLEQLLLEPARRAPDLKFCVAGPSYPIDIAWPANVERIDHVGPADHPAFYAASRFTLNVTRKDMIAAGHSPSVRLFEAAACACPVISDRWRGIGEIFEPGREILLASSPGEVLEVLRGADAAARDALAEAGRRRVMREHTADHRAALVERQLWGEARPREARAALNV